MLKILKTVAGCVSAFFFLGAVIAVIDSATDKAAGGGRVSMEVAILSVLTAGVVYAVMGLLVKIAENGERQAEALDEVVELLRHDIEGD